MKKIIAVFLSVLMVMSMFAISASAAQTDKTEAQVEAAIENVVGAFVGADKDAVVRVDADLAKKAVEENGKDITVGELSAMLADFVAVPLGEETKSVADKIADESVYKVTVLENGKKTVFILVDIASNPELFDVVVFHDAVMKMAENQKKLLPSDSEDVTLMDYNRIAGELALHAIVFKVTEPLAGIGSSTINGWYESAKIAELNINEDRAPDSIMVLLGQFIMQFIYAIASIFA